MKKMKISILFLGLAFMVSCNQPKETTEAEESDVVIDEQEAVLNTASATISSASGSTMTGEAIFTDLGDGEVTIKLTVENAIPGEHAVHLHQKGDCSAPDASSAGGHWNPTDAPHGKRPDHQFHAGDIANLEVGEDGNGELTMTVSGWSIGEPENTNIVDKAIVIHADADDFESQPAGAAGAREGCGVIKINN